MKILILGAGRNQLNAIKKAKEKGHTVVVSDYLPDAPGKRLADFSEMTSTFDIEGNIAVAENYGVDGVLTLGTDQPVLTAARVAESLSLPALISAETALKATNKKHMKEAFINHNIPTSKYLLINKSELDQPENILQKVSQMRFPVVVKPVDSQGQRGVFKIRQLDEKLISFMRQTFTFTRDKEIIIEEFCSGDEITISGWVEDYHPFILMVTDRPLLDVEPHLGIMTAHHFPSPYTYSHYRKIENLVRQAVLGLNIRSGPIYLQAIISRQRVELIEIACRIGGGHEDELIPLVTGIDIVDMLIDKSLGQTVDVTKLEQYSLLENHNFGQTKFIMAFPGHVRSWEGLDKVRTMPGVDKARFYDPGLKEIKEIVDSSTSRWGYIIVTGHSKHEVGENMANAYQAVQILDHDNNNLLRIPENL